jgi:uncharacterized membrane protein YhdT
MRVFYIKLFKNFLEVENRFSIKFLFIYLISICIRFVYKLINFDTKQIKFINLQ